MHTWDVIVVGLGAMGSATVAELAARGVRVLGLDRFEPPHTLGSSHGETRIIREAYYEHPQYVPLVKRAYECWHRLEAETGQRLFTQTGGLSIGPAGGALVSGALASAREHGLAHELLDADAVARDHPALRLEPDWVAVREPRAGILFPERCVAAHLLRARRAGASLRTHMPVTGWQVDRDTVTVDAGGERFSAGRLVLAAGPWVGALLADLALPIVVARQVVHWFGAGSAEADSGPDALPVFLIEHEPDRMIYGFPRLDAPFDGEQSEIGPGVKLSRHHEGAVTTADDVVRAVTTDERDDIERLRRRYLPSVDGPHLRSSVCLYTNTPDQDFLIDWHPHHAAVLVVSACSGHGFKFSSAIGEVAADLVTTGRAQFDLSPFRYGRWAR